MTEREYNRQRCRAYHLPHQLERARMRIRHLEAEALRIGRRDLVEAR